MCVCVCVWHTHRDKEREGGEREIIQECLWLSRLAVSHLGLLRFTASLTIVAALIYGVQNLEKQGVLSLQYLLDGPALSPVHSFCPPFTLQWPCTTQHFYLSSVAGNLLVPGQGQRLVSIPAWWSHGRNCREATEGRTRAAAGLNRAKRLGTEQLAPSPSLREKPAFVTDHWSVCKVSWVLSRYFGDNLPGIAVDCVCSLGEVSVTANSGPRLCVVLFIVFCRDPFSAAPSPNYGCDRLDELLFSPCNGISLVPFAWVLSLIAAAKW